MTEYRTQQIKLFSPTLIDLYYCRLTPSHFEWVFNDKKKQLDWRQIFIIEKFMTQRMSQAHIFIGIKNAEPLIIYSNHLPLSYRKVWQLLYDYQIKALGKQIIKIQ